MIKYKAWSPDLGQTEDNAIEVTTFNGPLDVAKRFCRKQWEVNQKSYKSIVVYTKHLNGNLHLDNGVLFKVSVEMSLEPVFHSKYHEN